MICALKLLSKSVLTILSDLTNLKKIFKSMFTSSNEGCENNMVFLENLVRTLSYLFTSKNN